MDHPLGTARTEDGRLVLRFERHLDHPPDKVWTAITDPAELSHWFPATVETEPRVGARMRFSFGEHTDLDSPYTEGEILELDRPKVFAFRWYDTVYRFELVPRDTGCLLLFSTVLNGTDTRGDWPSVARQAPGWDGCLDVLTARLDGQAPLAPSPAWFVERAQRYVEEYGLGRGEIQESRDGTVVRFERDLIPVPEQVWTTLVAGIEPVAGQYPPPGATHDRIEVGPVTAVERARLLEYTWLCDGAETGRVRFELAPQEPVGCRLVLTQTLPAERELCATALAAWQVHLELLFAALHGAEPHGTAPRADTAQHSRKRTEQLRRRYLAGLDG